MFDMPPAKSAEVALKKTMKDIAEACGVSVALVSRVINNDETLRIRPETREKILNEVEAQRFIPDHHARTLASSSTQGKRNVRIGYVSYKSTERIANPYFDKIIEGIKTLLTQQDCLVCTYYVDDVVRCQRQKRSLSDKRLDGLILFGAMPPNLIDYFAEQANYLSSVYGAEIPDADFVGSNMLETMNLAVDYALRLGYRRAGVIFGNDQEREAALRRYAQKVGLEIDEKFSFDAGNDYATAYEMVRGKVRACRPPHILLCMNDEMALGAIDALLDENYAVPEDVSVIGHDDIPRASYSRVPLTTVRIFKEEIGRLVSDLLLERIRYKRKFPVKLCVPCELIVRKSTKKRKKNEDPN